MFGQILLIAVAVAITAVLHLPAVTSLPTFATDVAGGAFVSAATQGVGLVTGIQQDFSFAGVALAAIGAGIGGALGAGAKLGNALGFNEISSPFLQGAVRGLATEALTDGIGLATGLRHGIDWAGIAAAGVGGGIGEALGKTAFDSLPSEENAGQAFASSAADAIANAATRSILTGSDFGDNIIKALPSVIGQTIGNLAVGQIASWDAPNTEATASADHMLPDDGAYLDQPQYLDGPGGVGADAQFQDAGEYIGGSWNGQSTNGASIVPYDPFNPLLQQPFYELAPGGNAQLVPGLAPPLDQLQSVPLDIASVATSLPVSQVDLSGYVPNVPALSADTRSVADWVAQANYIENTYNTLRQQDPTTFARMDAEAAATQQRIATDQHTFDVQAGVGLGIMMTPVALAGATEVGVVDGISAGGRWVASTARGLLGRTPAALEDEIPQGWKVGDDIYTPTKSGNEPAWSTVRSRFWKNEATSSQNGTWNEENLDRMSRGLAPQRYNFDKEGLESMELSHEPVPLRDGGRNVVPRWPQDHAAVDPFRYLRY